MLRADEAQDGIRLRELPALHGEHRKRAERGARLKRNPLIAVQPFVLEGKAGDVEGQAALFAAAGGCVEIGQLVQGHRRPRAEFWPLEGGGVLQWCGSWILLAPFDHVFRPTSPALGEVRNLE